MSLPMPWPMSKYGTCPIYTLYTVYTAYKPKPKRPPAASTCDLPGLDPPFGPLCFVFFVGFAGHWSLVVGLWSVGGRSGSGSGCDVTSPTRPHTTRHYTYDMAHGICGIWCHYTNWPGPAGARTRPRIFLEGALRCLACSGSSFPQKVQHPSWPLPNKKSNWPTGQLTRAGYCAWNRFAHGKSGTR
jgi:hypothetical protein